MSANDWKCEITCMLTHVEDRVTSILSNINQSGRSVDDEFLACFFETLNDRVKAIEARVIKEFKMEKMLGGNSTRMTSSTFRATTSTGAATTSTHVKSELENQIYNLIKIDEEAASECTFNESIPKTAAQTSPFGRVLLIIDSDDEDAVVEIPEFEPSEGRASRILLSVSTSSDMGINQSEGEKTKVGIKNEGDIKPKKEELDHDIPMVEIQANQKVCALIDEQEVEPTKNTASRSVSTSSEIIAQQSIECEATNIVRKSSSIDFRGQDEMTINKNGKRSRSNALVGGSCSADKGQQVKKKKIGIKTTSNNQSASEQKKTKRFKCTICEYSVNHKGSFNRHMRTHTGEKPYPCDRCGKRFMLASDLKRHAVTHTNRFPFHCKGCFRGFSQKGEKEAHDKVCMARRYECHLCRKFVTYGKTLMKRHIRQHTGEKPYRCEICMKHFTQKWDLKIHLNNIHTRINQ